MLPMLQGHETYGNHAVICYAYTRLVSTSTNAYKTYMKVADGWYTSPRYIDLATCLGDSYISIKFN